LLRKLLDPAIDQRAYQLSFFPREDDYAAVFIGDTASKVKVFTEAALEEAKKDDKLRPVKKGRSELLLWSATSEDITTWRGTAAEHFQSGYQRLGPHLKPGFTWYCWKFVEPGQTTGTSGSGLVFVNGHWTIFPKPYRAIR
jgi:hypothetical protein